MFHYTCTRCSLVININYIAREYVLPDRSTLPMMQRHVWCQTCAAICPAEALNEGPTTTEMRVRLLALSESELQHKTFNQAWERELRQKWVDDAAKHEQAIKAWHSIRRGPAACLKCRSPNIILPPDDDSDLEHGACGGTFVCEMTVFGGTFVSGRPHQYDPEGNLIAVGSRVIDVIGRIVEQPLELWFEDRRSGAVQAGGA